MRKNAFTLSEVLITVAIIGVVAALTIPVLITNYQRQANVTLLRKTINDFANAADMYITEEGKTKLSHTGIFDEGGIHRFMSTKFNVSSEAIFADTYHSISGKSKTYSCAANSYLLPSSAVVCVTPSTDKLHIQVDVNGDKDPNIGCRDMFDFYIDNDGKPVPTDLPPGKQCAPPKVCTPKIEDQALGAGCYKFLQVTNWKTDY